MRKHQDPPTHHHKSPSDWNRHFTISNYLWSILEVTMMNCGTWLGTLSCIPVRYCRKSKLSPFRCGINRIKLGYIVHWIVCFWRTHVMTKEQKKIFFSFFLFLFLPLFIGNRSRTLAFESKASTLSGLALTVWQRAWKGDYALLYEPGKPRPWLIFSSLHL